MLIDILKENGVPAKRFHYKGRCVGIKKEGFPEATKIIKTEIMKLYGEFLVEVKYEYLRGGMEAEGWRLVWEFYMPNRVYSAIYVPKEYVHQAKEVFLKEKIDFLEIVESSLKSVEVCPAFLKDTNHCLSFACECRCSGDSTCSDCYLNKCK